MEDKFTRRPKSITVVVQYLEGTPLAESFDVPLDEGVEQRVNVSEEIRYGVVTTTTDYEISWRTVEVEELKTLSRIKKRLRANRD